MTRLCGNYELRINSFPRTVCRLRGRRGHVPALHWLAKNGGLVPTVFWVICLVGAEICRCGVAVVEHRVKGGKQLLRVGIAVRRCGMGGCHIVRNGEVERVANLRIALIHGEQRPHSQ